MKTLFLTTALCFLVARSALATPQANDTVVVGGNTYGIFQRPNKDGTAEILVDGRPMRVNVHPNVDISHFEEGQLVVLNEAFNVVEGAGFNFDKAISRLSLARQKITLRHAGPMVSDCQLRRDPGVAWSRLVGPRTSGEQLDVHLVAFKTVLAIHRSKSFRVPIAAYRCHIPQMRQH